MEHTKLPWKSHWHHNRIEDAPDCGVFSEVIPGQAYSVVRCPRYQSRQQWLADSSFILKACNNYYDLIEAFENLLINRNNETIYHAKVLLDKLKKE